MLLEEGKAVHSNILTGRIPMDRRPWRASPWGCRVKHNWATKHTKPSAERWDNYFRLISLWTEKPMYWGWQERKLKKKKKTHTPEFLMTNGANASNLDSSISRFLAARIVIHLYCLSHCKALCHFAFKCILTYTHILCPCIDICYVYTFFAFLYFTWLVAMWSNKTRQSRKERKCIWAAVYQHRSGKKYSRLLHYHLPVSYLKHCWDTLTHRLWLSSNTVKYIPSFLISKISNLNQGTLRKILALTFYTSCSVY